MSPKVLNPPPSLALPSLRDSRPLLPTLPSHYLCHSLSSPSLYKHCITAPVAAHSGIVISPTHFSPHHASPPFSSASSHSTLYITFQELPNVALVISSHQWIRVVIAPVQHSLHPPVLQLPFPRMLLLHFLGLSIFSSNHLHPISTALLRVQTPTRCCLNCCFLHPCPTSRFLSYSFTYLLW